MPKYFCFLSFAKALRKLFKKRGGISNPENRGEMAKGEWIDASSYKQLGVGMRSLADKHLSMKRPESQCWYVTERLRMSDGKVHRYFIECTEIPRQDEKDFPEPFRDPNAPPFLMLLK